MSSDEIKREEIKLVFGLNETFLHQNSSEERIWLNFLPFYQDNANNLLFRIVR